MARFYNRVIEMEEWRLPKVVLNWDHIAGMKGWLADMTKVASELNLPLPMSGNFAYDLEGIQGAIKLKSRQMWKEEALSKPKLCTYVETRDL